MNDKISPKELLTREWIKRAEDDEINIIANLKHRDGTPTPICFLSQQMAEKYLKAFLVKKKKEFPKIHHLEFLLNLCLAINQSFANLKSEAVMLIKCYVANRYPGDYPEFTWQDAEKAYQAALQIKNLVLTNLEK